MHMARLPASHGICGGASLGSLFLALQQFMPSYFLPVRTAQAFIHIWGSSLHLAQSLSLHEKPVVRGEIANPQRLWLPLTLYWIHLSHVKNEAQFPSQFSVSESILCAGHRGVPARCALPLPSILESWGPVATWTLESKGHFHHEVLVFSSFE